MKKLLFIFLMGQLLLLSYIFSESVYDIYELNNLGDTSLKAYIVESFSGNELNELYEGISSLCLSDKTCRLQLVKTPVSSEGNFIYDIYHSQVKDINNPESISSDTFFNYHQLSKEDFVDNNGVFYSDLSSDKLNSISKKIGITIEPYNDNIAYSQVIRYNILNFIILFLLTQLVLFIYTFTRIKVNAIKTMLGYSKFKMISASLKEFITIEIFAMGITLCIHFMYYLFIENIVPRYFYTLLVFLIIIILINIVLLLFTQISLRFIEMNLMIKNKIYSNRLNHVLYGIKILLILAITVSMSYFFSTYSDHKNKLSELDKYRQLESYYTSNGYNSDEFEKARNNLKLLKEYGDSVKKIYTYFDQQEQLYVSDAYILELLDPGYLERNGLRKEDLYSSIRDNFIVVNERYIKDFMQIRDETGTVISNSYFTEPAILVPSKYKSQEPEIKKIYMEKYNELLNYNQFYGVPNLESNKVDNLKIRYIENNQEYELLGQNAKNKDNSSIKLKDTIFIIDQGNFSSLYYYDLLNAGNMYFNLEQRDELSQTLSKYGLEKLVNVGTLLTPYMNEVHFVEFVMYNSLVFTVLFLFTLIFVIYISNYVDITSNSRRYTIQYIYGFDLLKTFKTHIIIYFLLICAIIINLFLEFNILLYVLMLVTDFTILLLVYKKIIKNDINKLVKGG